MRSISLACYSVRFREANQRTFLSFDSPKLTKLETFFGSYFSKLKKASVNNAEDKRMMGLRSFQTSGTITEGIIETGDYGYEAELRDTNGKTPSYKRKKNQAQMLPFYFLLHLPKSGEVGVLILQRTGVFGIRTVLCSDLAAAFADQYPGINMNAWPQVPDGVLDHLMRNGHLRSIVLRKNQLPADMVDKLGKRDVKSGMMDIVISARQGSYFQGVLDKISSRIKSAAPESLNDVVTYDGFRHDKILIGIKIGEKNKTVDLSNLYKLRSNIDVTKKVKLGEDGHPTFASISKEAADLLKGINTAIDVRL